MQACCRVSWKLLEKKMVLSVLKTHAGSSGNQGSLHHPGDSDSFGLGMARTSELNKYPGGCGD